VDWEQLANGNDSEAALSADDLASTLTGVNDRFATDDGDQVLVQEFVADEDPPLRITGWHRVGRRGRHVVLAHFSFVVDEAQAELPELLAVRDLIGREAVRALLIPRPSRP
jgi:hypothetical protein